MKKRIVELEQLIALKDDPSSLASGNTLAGTAAVGSSSAAAAAVNGDGGAGAAPGRPVRQYKVEGTAAFLEEYISREATNFTPVVLLEPTPAPNSAASSKASPKAKRKADDSTAGEAAAEAAKVKRERLVVAFMDEYGGARLKERPNAFWEKHQNREKRQELVEDVRWALSDLGPGVRGEIVGFSLVSSILPPLFCSIADRTLVSAICQPIRAMGIFNRCIWMESLINDFEDFVAKREKYANGWADMNQLALFAIGVSVGLQFYPGVGTVRRSDPDTMKRWNRREVQRWHELGKRCLALEENKAIVSLEGLQALVLIAGQGLESTDYLAFIDDVLRRGVIAMDLHKLGKLPMLGYEAGSTPEACRRKEMAVRLFWHIVARDWSLGQQTRCYTFHCDQITTRPPLNITDNDMRSIPFPPSRPFSEWTEMSVTIAKLHLSHIIRGSIDMLNEQARQGGSARIWNHDHRVILDEQYQHFLKQLPAFFQLDVPFEPAAEGWKAAAEVQRWLLHQLVFSLLLKVHRSDLGKKVSTRRRQQTAA